MSDRKPVVLFLCTGNSCRSQMAEALLRRHAGDRFAAHSAGVEPTEIHPITRKVLAEKGISMDGQHAKDVGEYLGKLPVFHLVTVCSRAAAACPTVWPGVGDREDWSIDDPAAAEGDEDTRLQKFREVRDRIEQKVIDWIERHDR